MQPVKFLAWLALLAGLAVAQDARWPAPPDGWWRGLTGDERATYELRQGPRAGRRTLAIERVEGSRLTVSDEQREADGAPRRQSSTIDVQDPQDVGDLALPPGARLERTGQEELKVGERSLTCDVYDVTLQGPRGVVSMTTWHCPRLPPVFMGGVVKLVSRAGGIEASLTLVEYHGKLIGE
jgi:hypothetical protein